MKLRTPISNRTTPDDRKVAVLWTRVSTKEQAENNLSLDTQEKACLQYAERNHIEIDRVMGQTNESAKTEGRLFREMIAYVSSHRRVNTILVYSYDRFSRAGAEGIITKAYLKSKGICVVSVTQPIDGDSMAGEFLENILFLFNQFENNLRRDKCRAGMVECLERGDWFGLIPLGYKKDPETKEKHRFIIDEKTGPLVKQMFLWKADGVDDSTIHRLINRQGLKVCRSRVPKILSNPFYTGKIKNRLLGERIIHGNHPALIDEETFAKANGHPVVSYTPTLNENEGTPLRGYIRCSCGKFLTAYEVKKKHKYYYKCNTRGCHSNISAKKLHAAYADLLRSYALPSPLLPQFTQYLQSRIAAAAAAADARASVLKAELSSVQDDIKTVTTRYGTGRISSEIYRESMSVLQEKSGEIQAEIERLESQKSNLADDVPTALATASRLAEYWADGTMDVRRKIQNSCICGVVKEKGGNGNNLTFTDGGLFRLIRSVRASYGDFTKRKEENPYEFSSCVGDRRIELLFRE